MMLHQLPNILRAAIADPKTSIAGGSLGLTVILVGVVLPLLEGQPFDWRVHGIYAFVGLGLTALGLYAKDSPPPPPAPPKESDDAPPAP
jgi:hypothetical protein